MDRVNTKVSYMYSEITTRKRNPALGFVIGSASAPLWAGIVASTASSMHTDMFGIARIMSVASGFFAGLILGCLAGSVGALAGGLTGQSSVDRFIGGLISGLISFGGVLILTPIVAMLFGWQPFTVWTSPYPLVLLVGTSPGILGGALGAASYLTTRATCAACGEFVQSTATGCPRCGATFDWQKRVDRYS